MCNGLDRYIFHYSVGQEFKMYLLKWKFGLKVNGFEKAIRESSCDKTSLHPF